MCAFLGLGTAICQSLGLAFLRAGEALLGLVDPSSHFSVHSRQSGLSRTALGLQPSRQASTVLQLRPAWALLSPVANY